MSRQIGACRGGSVLELHLSSLSHAGVVDLPSRFGHLIREIGGDYNECRGYHTTRFVTLPADARGAALAITLLEVYPADRWGKKGSVVLGRPRGAEVVHGRAPIGGEAETIARVLGATRGAALRVELDAYDRRQAAERREREARPARLRAERAALLARLAEIDAELGGAA